MMMWTLLKIASCVFLVATCVADSRAQSRASPASRPYETLTLFTNGGVCHFNLGATVIVELAEDRLMAGSQCTPIFFVTDLETCTDLETFRSKRSDAIAKTDQLDVALVVLCETIEERRPDPGTGWINRSFSEEGFVVGMTPFTIYGHASQMVRGLLRRELYNASRVRLTAYMIDRVGIKAKSSPIELEVKD